jgi:hypothetical protein
MRGIVLFVLVAALAFAAGAAGANGTLSRLLSGTQARLLGDARVGGTPSAARAGQRSAPASASAAATDGPVAARTAPAAAPREGATAVPSPSAASGTKPPPPLSLGQHRPDGTALAADGWTGAGGLTLHVLAPVTTAGLRAEVEVRPVEQAFRDTPSSAAPVEQGVAAIAVHGLAAGQYHWQARLTSAGGAGVWTPYAQGAAAFGVQPTPPRAPVVTSPTDPHSGTLYATATVSFTWSTPADPAGIAGYSYRLDTDPRGQAREVIRTQAQQVSLGGLGTGTYYFHVRAVDAVGNWSPSTTFRVRIDVTAPRVTRHRFSAYYFDPALEALRLSYTLSKVSRVTIGIYNATGRRVRHIVPRTLLPAHVPLSVTWDGRDNAGHVVPAGSYSLWLRATDRLGNSHSIGWSRLTVEYKRIVVSLSQQRLWAYDGNKLLLTTLVTTGNKVLPTPTGVFHVMFKRSPFVFRSPWPKGSPYYYLPTRTTYALYFHDYGYYIHDAPWRSVFGPGSNATPGTPGQNYTGTHGCVNVPRNVMARLYTWATPGTAVLIKT